MNILHIITRLDRGGSAEDVLMLCCRLSGPGTRHIVVYGSTHFAPQWFMDEARGKGVTFHCLPALRRAVHPVHDLAAFIAIYSLLRRERPDIVHTHTSKAGILGRWAAWLYRVLSRRRVSIAHTTHGHVFYGYFSRFVSHCFVIAERWSASRADRIVVLTPSERDDHLCRGIGRREQFLVIPSGVCYEAPPAAEYRERFSIPHGALLAGSVGRLDPIKGYAVFIDAMRRLLISHPGMYFMLVGDGNERPALERIAVMSGVGARCIFTGWQVAPAGFIAAMDIYVQPSLNEGMGKTILAAQLLGKPVVASAVQGIASLITTGETGILVPPGDSAALAVAMSTLADDPALRARLGGAARACVTARDPVSGNYRYSAEEMILRYALLYRSMASAPAASPSEPAYAERTDA